VYSETQDYYDLIYGSSKDFEEEARKIADLIEEVRPGARTLLDVACGTGQHLARLSSKYRADGLDLDARFVEIASGNAPQATIHRADMTSFDLGKIYDVVMCIFGSIGYAKTPGAVTSALGCFREHLAPGGVVLVEPWFTPATWYGRGVHLVTMEQEELKIARMNTHNTEGRISTVDFCYLIGTPDGMEIRREKHELGLFTTDEMKQCFVDAGLEATHLDEGVATNRGIYVGRAATQSA
jgi:SAM-dependent methyltransferase